MKAVGYWNGTIKNYRYDEDISIHKGTNYVHRILELHVRHSSYMSAIVLVSCNELTEGKPAEHKTDKHT